LSMSSAYPHLCCLPLKLLPTYCFSGECTGDCRSKSDCRKFCDPTFHGKRVFICKDGKWQKSTDTCATLNAGSLLKVMQLVCISLENVLRPAGYTGMAFLSGLTEEVLSSPPVPGNIGVIVEVLKKISQDFSMDVNRENMQNYISMANHILNGTLIPNWAYIKEKNACSILLESIILFARKLHINNRPEKILERFIAIKASKINKNTPERSFEFSLGFNDSSKNISGAMQIPKEELQKLSTATQVISIALPTLGVIMEENLLDGLSVNGMVSLNFEKIDKSEDSRTQCVAWHSIQRTWDKSACEVREDTGKSAMCICKHEPNMFQSFSILVSPNTVQNTVLKYISQIGLGVSICSLVLCLTIEAVVWGHVTQTEISYMRHVCLVNIAVSLLVADVLFILAAFLHGVGYNVCAAATFFVHFFYLSLFCWMLALGLLILYALLIVFWKMRKSVLLAVQFSIGYGCPLIISVITVAATEPRKGYLREEACWLNWHDTKALLAFIIPALAIVGANVIVVLVVVAKTGRSSIGRQQDLSTAIRISKNVVLLTPLLGLTWGIGLATVLESTSLTFHVLFAVLNAFQNALHLATRLKATFTPAVPVLFWRMKILGKEDIKLLWWAMSL
uniref:G-protein coupled receptors family 2 profile 2 domain-containing protein n=1 Tax=Sphenodon punctatus TaxID=8508 RepID=A0A8D0GQP1_SPHPU